MQGNASRARNVLAVCADYQLMGQQIAGGSALPHPLDHRSTRRTLGSTRGSTARCVAAAMFRTKSRRVTSSRSSSNLNEVTIEEDVRCARILVLLTGGTMAMKPNAHGSLEPSAGSRVQKGFYLFVQIDL